MDHFRLSEAFSEGFWRVRTNPRIVIAYLAIAVLGPLLVFSLFEQSSMRHFMVVFAEPSAFYSAETPRTIMSMFLIALFIIWAALFAAWNALLSPSRDGMVVEIMNGAVAALFCVLIVTVFYVAYSIVIAIVMAFSMGTTLTALGASTTTPSLPFLPMLISALSWIPLLWLSARLVVTGPVMAEIGSINPFSGLAKSWKLTGHAQWRIFAYLFAFQLLCLLLLIGGLILSIRLILSSDGTGWHDMVVTMIWMAYNAIMFLLYLAVPMGLFIQLRPDMDLAVFE